MKMKLNMKKPSGAPGLWTWDFTIITLGSIVSLIGGVLSSFAMSMMVLDYTACSTPSTRCPCWRAPYWRGRTWTG